VVVLPYKADLALPVFHFELDHAFFFHQVYEFFDVVDFHRKAVSGQLSVFLFSSAAPSLSFLTAALLQDVSQSSFYSS
jgi:hypothetical protein